MSRHISLKTDGTEKFVYFNYSPDTSVISETDVDLETITTLISGNEVEFNKTFTFKNVVSVGLSYGFLEPLEGTGLASMFINSFRLLEAISKRDMNYTQLDRDLFNNSSGEYGIDGWKSQIESHYYLSTRTDSEYWTYVTEDIDYKNRIDSIFSYELFLYRCGITRSYNTNDPGLMFIAGGMNYSPFSRAIILSDDLADKLKVIPEFEDELESLVEDVKEFPSSCELLRKNIYS